MAMATFTCAFTLKFPLNFPRHRSKSYLEFAELCNGKENPISQSFFEKAKKLFQ